MTKTDRIKGLAKARRGAVMRRRGGEALSRETEEWLFEAPDVLCEGSVREGRAGKASWFGSTMITFDLDTIASRYRGTFDRDAQNRLVSALEGSVRVRIRAMRIACAEVARRLPDRRLGTAQVETRVRLVDQKLHLDVDLEVPIGVSSRRRRR